MLSQWYQTAISDMNRVKATMLDIFFPRQCFHCNIEGVWLCNAGKQAFKRYVSYRCAVCGIPLKGPTLSVVSSNACKRCCKEFSLDGLFIAADFGDSVVRAMIHAMKYEYVQEVAGILGEFVAEMLRFRMEDKQPYTLIPVPLHRRKALFRGFNQAELMAQEVSACNDVPVSADLLARSSDTSPQVELDKEKRALNIQGAFSLRKALSLDTAFLLLDDVMTTGATLSECARTLRRGGAKRVFAAVAAKG